jgi:hypothetical protein
MAGKKGSTWSKAMTQQQRDSIALTKIEKYIDAQIDDVLICPECEKEHGSAKDLSTAAVALIRARYDKLRPTLSAVEQTIHEEQKSEDELIQGLANAIKANPALLRPVIEADHGVRAALASILSGQPVPVECGVSAETAPQHGPQGAVDGAKATYVLELM